eukprot:13882-Heterococcus_DN1.PRE.5
MSSSCIGIGIGTSTGVAVTVPVGCTCPYRLCSYAHDVQQQVSQQKQWYSQYDFSSMRNKVAAYYTSA